MASHCQSGLAALIRSDIGSTNLKNTHKFVFSSSVKYERLYIAIRESSTRFDQLPEKLCYQKFSGWGVYFFSTEMKYFPQLNYLDSDSFGQQKISTRIWDFPNLSENIINPILYR